MQHGGVPHDTQRRAQAGEGSRRIGQHISRIDHRRRMAQPVSLGLEPGALLGETQPFRRHHLALLRIAGDHPFRRADQEGVGETRQVRDLHRASHVVDHMLLIPDRARARPRQSGGHTVPIAVHRGDHLGRHRVIIAGVLEVGAVERLVAHRRIGTRAETAHHCGRKIARAGPHCDAKRLGDAKSHGRARAATSASISLRYRPCSRSTIGPRASVSVRPSMLVTGTTPAKVPVTNASLAE